jgi:hypothetical protein
MYGWKMPMAFDPPPHAGDDRVGLAGLQLPAFA